MLTLTSPVETWLHRLPAAGKLAALAVFTAGLLVISKPFGLIVATVSVAFLHFSCGTALLTHALRMLRPLWPFVAVVALWHLWTATPEAGAVVILRLVAAVAAANLVTMTTRLSEMIAVLETLARPLSPVLPPRRLALALALAIRFVPVLSERVARLAEAWRARSPRRPAWRIVAPAALSALDDAERVAEALRARGGAG
jgi:biotin transport system permease protein